MDQISLTVKDDDIKICYYFDLIVGIVVGEVNAFMLGRLRLNIDNPVQRSKLSHRTRSI